MKLQATAKITLAVLLLATPLLLRAAEPATLEVTENPSLLVTPGVKAADFTFYGAKLGDSIDKIDSKAGIAKKEADNNVPEIINCIGRDIAYITYKDKIVQIIVDEALLAHLPPFDAARLQITLGKADQIDTTASDPPVWVLTFISLQMKVTISGAGLRSRITSISVYAP